MQKWAHGATAQVTFGKTGVEKIHPVWTLNSYEEGRLKEAQRTLRMWFGWALNHWNGGFESLKWGCKWEDALSDGPQKSPVWRFRALLWSFNLQYIQGWVSWDMARKSLSVINPNTIPTITQLGHQKHHPRHRFRIHKPQSGMVTICDYGIGLSICTGHGPVEDWDRQGLGIHRREVSEIRARYSGRALHSLWLVPGAKTRGTSPSPVITDGSLIDSGVAVATTMWRKSKNGVPLKSNGSSSQKIAMLGFHFLDYAMTRCGGFWCTFQVPQESWVDLRPGKSRGPRVGSMKKAIKLPEVCTKNVLVSTTQEPY
jgi:hypothetical protein